MPIDPNIIAGLRPVQIQTPDPLEQYGKTLTLRHLMQQGDLGTLQYEKAQREGDAEKRLNALFASNPNATAEDVMAIDPQKGFAYKKLQLEGEAKRVEIDKNRQEILAKAVASHRDDLANVKTPQDAARWVATAYQDPVLSPVVSRMGTAEETIAKIPQDPDAFERWRQQSALGATKFIEMNKPHVTSQNLGGTEQLVATPGLGGAPSVLSTTPRTQTPDSRSADARARETLAETSRHHRVLEGDPEKNEQTAQAIAKGQLAPLSGFALSRPSAQNVMARVVEINPDFDPTQFATRQKAEKDFATGKQGQSVKSFNVAISHLGTLDTLVDALNNKDTKLINQIANAYQTQTGSSSAPTNFEAAKQIVGDEIVKAIVGAGGGVADRDKAQAQLDKANSPKLLKDVIGTYKDLMKGQLDGLRKQYEATTGKQDFDKKFLSEDARAVAHGAPKPAGAGAQSDIRSQADAILAGRR